MCGGGADELLAVGRARSTLSVTLRQRRPLAGLLDCERNAMSSIAPTRSNVAVSTLTRDE